jgi:hypothetical protein
MAEDYEIDGTGQCTVWLYEKFLSVTGWMQKGAGEKDISYAQEDIAHLLGCAQETVSKLTQQAIKDAYMRSMAANKKTKKRRQSKKIRKVTTKQGRQRTSKSGKSKQPKNSPAPVEEPLADKPSLT